VLFLKVFLDNHKNEADRAKLCIRLV